MPKCGFSNFIEIALQHGYSPTNFLHIFGTSFYNNTSGGLPLNSKRSERPFYLSLLNLTPRTRNEINLFKRTLMQI